jgi:hypothetical protein
MNETSLAIIMILLFFNITTLFFFTAKVENLIDYIQSFYQLIIEEEDECN